MIAGVMLAMDTLASQANGARNYELVGSIAQRAALITAILCIPVILLWYNITPVLLFFGQDPKVTQYASSYLRWFAFGLAPNLLFEVARKFLVAQSIVSPIAWIMAIALLWHVVATYVLIWPAGLGFIGSPIACATTYLLMLGLMVLYMRFGHRWFGTDNSVDPLRCWGGFSREAFREWGSFLLLGLPSCVQLCGEWWSFELVVLAAGYLGKEELAASNIVQQLYVCVWWMFHCISTVSSSCRR